MEITNYVQVSEKIYTSGQPGREDFQKIADLGVSIVVNLAMPDSDNAIADEVQLVTFQVMNYIHIPVVWTEPKREQYELFQSILSANEDKKIWVHCALNWRVSSFIYMYKIQQLGISRQEAYQELLKVWEPNETWREFINS